MSRVQKIADLKNYKLYCQKVNEYFREFPFLRALKTLQLGQIISYFEDTLSLLPEKLRVSKIQILKGFKYTTWAAWKGRKEYEEKYINKVDGGHEYYAKSLYDLYQKSHLYLKRFIQKNSIVNQVTKMESNNQYEMLFLDEPEMEEEIENELSQMSIKDDKKEEIELTTSDEKITDTSLRIYIVFARIEFLTCAYLNVVRMFILSCERQRIEDKILQNFSGTEEDKIKEIAKAAYFFIEDVFKKKLGKKRYGQFIEQIATETCLGKMYKSNIDDIQISYSELKDLILELIIKGEIFNEKAFYMDLLPFKFPSSYNIYAFLQLSEWIKSVDLYLLFHTITCCIHNKIQNNISSIFDKNLYKILFPEVDNDIINLIEKLLPITISHQFPTERNFIVREYKINKQNSDDSKNESYFISIENKASRDDIDQKDITKIWKYFEKYADKNTLETLVWLKTSTSEECVKCANILEPIIK